LHGDPVHRIAGLLHDLGKPATRVMSDKTRDWTFYNHETVGADMADKWLRDYRFANEERERIVHLVRHHLVCYSPEWTDAAVRRFVKRVGTGSVADLLSLARADARGKGRPVEPELAAIDELAARIQTAVDQGAAFGVGQLVIGGRDVMTRLHLAPSRRVGQILERLLDAVLEQPELNEREALLTLVDRIGNEH
jgi:tRNA nucleotidyltransferase (CCA-adding enzyme)